MSPLGARSANRWRRWSVTSSIKECSHPLRALLLPTGVPPVMPAVDHMADPQRPLASTFAIREAREDDWPQIWPIIHDIITERQTFTYAPP
jgi:hypothetical protein